MKTVTYNIDDGKLEIELKFSKLKTKKSLKFLMYLGKLMGNGAGGIVGALSGKDNKISELMNVTGENVDAAKLGDVISLMVNRIDEDEVIEKLDILLGSVKHDGKPIDLDYFIFDDNLGLIFKVAKEAMEVNYKSFLQENFGVFSKLIRTVELLKNGKDLPPTPM